MSVEALRISAVVPMYNAVATIERCLAPLVAMRERDEITEIIVVDDCSTDQSSDIVSRYPAVRLIHMAAQGGPGAARNQAAHVAHSTHLWFVDSDVVAAEDAARVLARALRETQAAAVFGCYDNRPAATNFLSQYKNLVHHYYHYRGSKDASTFWAGCGAVERTLFQALGGFDAARYRYPSIEDIELGYRMRDAGARIVLERTMQGKHLKEWRLRNLLHTDIFRRAIPWSRLMLERKNITNDLNVGTGERIRAVLTLSTIAAFLAWPLGLASPWAATLLAVATVLANGNFIRFFRANRGLPFAVKALLFHQLYYVYSSFAFAFAAAHRFRARAWYAGRRRP